MTMVKTSTKATGSLIAAFLAGAWRPSPPALDFSATDFERIAPLLLQTGAGALGWGRVRESELQSSDAAQELRQAYRLNTLNSCLNQSKIEKVFALLRSAGIEPILIKGWAAARYYPEQGLRPYGDIDICVRSDHYENSERALASLDPLRFRVDLHSGFAKFGIKGEAELLARSQLVTLGQTEVRILSAEDHLRVVCFHLMREGAWRPLWLVDVAAALESRPRNFDWNYCLGERRQARPVISAIGLAHLLLGAEIDCIPEAQRFNKHPRWVAPTVLNEWGSATPSMPSRHAVPMLRHLRRQGDVLNGLRHRWPNPIEATTTMNGPFNELPRLPFQIGNSLFRIGVFLSHLPKARNK
jgi:hypothetical protein